MVAFLCPKCQAGLNAPAEMAGARMMCPRCGCAVQVPQPLPIAAMAAPVHKESQTQSNARLLLLCGLGLLGGGMVLGILLVFGLGLGGWLIERELVERDAVAAGDDVHPAARPDDAPRDELAKPAPHKPGTQAPQEPAPKAHDPGGNPVARTDLDDLLRDNYQFPGKARPGKPFSHQFHLEGAALSLHGAGLDRSFDSPFTLKMNAEEKEQWEAQRANGRELAPMSLTAQGLFTWTPSLGLPARTYYVRVQLARAGNSKVPTGTVLRTIKIILEEDPDNAMALPSFGGWVMQSDGVTLIAALPDQGQLAYIDTVANKERKRVELPFKPDRLALQGKRLFASVQDANSVHILDLDSGADQSAIKLNGVVVDMVCNRQKGLVYAAMASGDILAIDPHTGTAVPTGARGTFLAMDPRDGNAVYAALQTVQTTTSQVVVGQRTRVSPSGRETIETRQKTVENTTVQGQVAKLLVKGTTLRQIDVAPSDCGPARVSADGQRVGVAGRLFLADDLKSPAGVIAKVASDLAFHPVLPLGAAETENIVAQPGQPLGVRSGKTLHLFKSDSLAEITTLTLSAFPFMEPSAPPGGSLLMFGARGAKLLYYDRPRGYLRSIPLMLSAQDRAILGKSYTDR
jgi:hypothetical protein